jgi:hypothetical protein
VPGKSCHSPFREDKNPSFSIYDEGRRWKDFSTGEGGDVIDFIERAVDSDASKAITIARELAGITETAAVPAARTTPKLHLQRLRSGTPADDISVARSRRIHPGAVSLGASLGTIKYGKVCGYDCWILTDSALKIAEARRIDGKPFPAHDGLPERKAHTLRGSSKSWPAGVAVLVGKPDFRAIMFVEGGPDYLAALHLAIDVGDVLPVAMLGRGAGAKIDPAALSLLAGRAVYIYPHADPDGGGAASARTWAAQLHNAGCVVRIFNFAGLKRKDGKPVKDLNDAVLIADEHRAELHALLP